MPVEYWSFAGLLLTYWCNARCDSCYLKCSSRRGEWFDVEEALGVWRSLIDASPYGCRVHIGGGEPFGRWETLIELCRRARQEGLGPLEKVETNAFWATDERVVRDRLAALDDAGMQTLVVSSDPYHQQFVPIERCRLATRVAEDMLGRQRVRVRWRDWLDSGFDTGSMSQQERNDLFTGYAAQGRDRMDGRAAERLSGLLPRQAISDFRGRKASSCCEALLRSRHVHVGPDGVIIPGTCAGLVLGRVRVTPGDAGSPPYVGSGADEAIRAKGSIAEVWRGVSDCFGGKGGQGTGDESRPIVSTLAKSGPIGLLELAVEAGFAPLESYCGKCHLCWDIRRFLHGRGLYGQELGPPWLYDVE